MNAVKIYVTARNDAIFPRYFPGHVLERLEKLGEVEYWPHARTMTREELAEILPEVDILVTHWGTPQVDAELLAKAPKLKLLAHAAGTVAHIASEAFYEKGIPVLSANPIMAKYVAEGALCYLLAGLRLLPQHDDWARENNWERHADEQRNLFGARIGLVGCGAAAREFLDLLRPFGCDVAVYDPYLPENGLDRWEFAHAASLEEVMSRPIVSIHAAQTPETYHMINAERLRMMPDGAILINTARGSLIDTAALIPEVQSGRIFAILDVYEREGPGHIPEELIACKKNTILQPHLAAAVSWPMTAGIIDDIERFLKGEELRLTVSLGQYRLMTQE